MASAPQVIDGESQDGRASPAAGLLGSELGNLSGRLGDQRREDRIAAVFGLLGGTLPAVKQTTLLAYYQYLRAHLSIPFKAEYCAAHERTAHKVTVVGLLSPTRPGVDNSRGLVCLARCRGSVLALPLVDLEVSESDSNFQFLEDYWYWAWNWGIASGVGIRERNIATETGSSV